MFTLVIPWVPFEVHLEPIWDAFGVPLGPIDAPFAALVIPLEPIWDSFGVLLRYFHIMFALVIPWGPLEIHLEFIWDPFGLPLGSLWGPWRWGSSARVCEPGPRVAL